MDDIDTDFYDEDNETDVQAQLTLECAHVHVWAQVFTHVCVLINLPMI